jgi:deoxyribodipyrimidine photo-lyase
MPRPISIFWFRRDFRLHDNPALHAALAKGCAVVPLYVWDPAAEGEWAPGAATRWWLHRSLHSIDAVLRNAGSRLIIRRGPTLETLLSLIAETGAHGVFWNRLYEPAAIARDAEIKGALRSRGITAESRNASLLFEPWTVTTKTGTAYRVFTPFYRACLSRTAPEAPLPPPKSITAPDAWPDEISLESLKLLPRIPWDTGIAAHWNPGESSALAQLEEFATQSVAEYSESRERPDRDGTSRVSPHLNFGEHSTLRLRDPLVVSQK